MYVVLHVGIRGLGESVCLLFCTQEMFLNNWLLLEKSGRSVLKCSFFLHTNVFICIIRNVIIQSNVHNAVGKSIKSGIHVM